MEFKGKELVYSQLQTNPPPEEISNIECSTLFCLSQNKRAEYCRMLEQPACRPSETETDTVVGQDDHAHSFDDVVYCTDCAVDLLDSNCVCGTVATELECNKASARVLDPIQWVLGSGLGRWTTRLLCSGRIPPPDRTVAFASKCHDLC